MSSFSIRTVLDARNRSSKYFFQVLLLAASWHKRVRHTAPLEVLVVGEPPSVLRDFLRDVGVSHRLVQPDLNDHICRTSNTIVGACNPAGQRILLVDNDVVFWGDLSALKSLDPQPVMGCVAGTRRLTESQWAAIAEHFGCSPLETDTPPLGDLLKNLGQPGFAPRPLKHVYVNGGVLLLPPNEQFGAMWRRWVGEIAELFRDHPLRSGSVYGSNMAGLSMAIAEYAKFAWLDTRFNYRPKCFALGLEPQRRIEIVHLTGVDATHQTVTRRIDDYWQRKMRPVFRRARFRLPRQERLRRLEIANALRDELLSLVEEYDIERWATQLPADFAPPEQRRGVAQSVYLTYGTALRTAAWLKRQLFASTVGS